MITVTHIEDYSRVLDQTDDTVRYIISHWKANITMGYEHKPSRYNNISMK